ncbi:hypothetical protein GWK08_13005 [Leptobacterium flavescens]|uniref:Uncharacterized protein n=1 Tax=Leptobacterium flavescens TaxID=472055 RepID=A0A6P0UMC5_9FLAO|nr:hypothetical protein [Leptobacterium flavescens]NER14365.1 hypothetical protein [Leptobacterium flavescens]
MLKTGKPIFLLLLLFCLNFNYSQNVEGVYLAFYERGDDLTKAKQSELRTKFKKKDARYVYSFLKVENMLYNIRDQEVKVRFNYYKEDGSLFGSPEKTYKIPKDWKRVDLWTGWGYATTNRWQAGRYTVKAMVEGRQIAQGMFYIDNTSESGYISKVNRVRFFEGGEKVPETKNYATAFSKSTSRSIYTEVNFPNAYYNVKDWKTDITLRYYKPDGSLFGSPKINRVIPKTWKSANVWRGWGWTSTGNWPLGNYRVEVWDGDTMLSSGYFTINN